MKVAQHWRMNAYRYQLRGTRHEDGTVFFANRPEVTQRIKEHYLLEERPAVAENKSKVEQIA